ncbi:amino acid transporter [Gigaspora margarita]|uniref:Amino acid transporter n=1 Tax=Gigaspora margarita TaxID=4874 RepID=A0A8H4AVF4_GIGMA|nr:amino acid transporter [Gigaspora margarita]
MTYENNITNFQKTLGIFYGLGYNINRIIGAGIFNPDRIFTLVQSPGIALVLYAFCGIISLLGGLIYIELGIRSLPAGLGEQKYITDAYPNETNLGHVFSYVVIFIILPGAMVANSYNCAQYILFVFRGYFNNDYDVIAVIISVLILLVITSYHLASKKLPDIINQTLAFVKITSLIIISVIGLVRLAGTDSDNWINIFKTSSNFDAYGLGTYGNGLIQILYAYEGWNSANYLIEEIIMPDPNNLAYPSLILKYSSLISIAISFLLYFFTNAAFITVLGNGLTQNEDIPIALRFGKKLLPGTGENIMSIIVAISSFGSVSVMVFLFARIIKYAAETKFIPKISNYLNRFSNRNILAKQLWAQFGYCLILTLLFSIKTNCFIFSSDTSQYLAMLSHAACAWCLYILKRTLLDEMDKADNNKPFSIPKYIILIYFSMIILIIITSLFPPKYGDIEYLIPYIISWIATILGFIFWYYLNPKNRNEKSANENEETKDQVCELNISHNDEIKQNSAEIYELTLKTP